MPINLHDIKGAIFDIDDTLLDNNSRVPALSLHSRSRLAAVHQVGEYLDIIPLQLFTSEQNVEAFLTAKSHTIDAAVWNILFMTGLVTTEDIEPDHKLLLEIVKLKIHLHESLLKTEGKAVPGAIQFVEKLAATGLQESLAIASTAVRSEIVIFLTMANLTRFFPEDHIISRETVTHPKPHPQAYDLAFECLGLPQSDRTSVLAFEDDPRGIMSAKAAGLFTCAITTRFSRGQLSSLETPPDLIAASFAQFETKLALR